MNSLSMETLEQVKFVTVQPYLSLEARRASTKVQGNFISSISLLTRVWFKK